MRTRERERGHTRQKLVQCAGFGPPTPALAGWHHAREESRLGRIGNRNKPSRHISMVQKKTGHLHGHLALLEISVSFQTNICQRHTTQGTTACGPPLCALPCAVYWIISTSCTLEVSITRRAIKGSAESCVHVAVAICTHCGAGCSLCAAASASVCSAVGDHGRVLRPWFGNHASSLQAGSLISKHVTPRVWNQSLSMKEASSAAISPQSSMRIFLLVLPSLLP